MTRDEFLKKYLTVVGKNTAVDNHDENFIKKYLTQVGCPAGSGSGSGSGSGEHTLLIVKDNRGSGDGELTSNKESYKAGETARIVFTPSTYGSDKILDVKVLTDGEYRPDAQGELSSDIYSFEVPDDKVKPYENLTAKYLLIASANSWKEIDLNATGSGSGSFELHNVHYEKAVNDNYDVSVYCNTGNPYTTITNITTDGTATVKILSDSDPVELPIEEGSCEFDVTQYAGDITVQVKFTR